MFQHVGLFRITLFLLAVLSSGSEVVLKDSPVALTRSDEPLMAPQWSPDGTQIAASGTNYVGLYLIHFPSGRTTQISKDFAVGYGFSWSHSGKYIATKSSRFEGMLRKHTLLSINVKEGGSQVLTGPRTRMSGIPRWSSTDSHVYLTQTDKFESFPRDKQNTTSFREPLLYLNNGQLIQYNAGSAKENRLFSDQDRISSFSLSPDGSKIVYSSSGQKLWIANRDGSERHSLGSGIAPSWAPDSEWIVFMYTEDDGHIILTSEIYIMNIKDNVAINITHTPNQLEMHPQWSPDGYWIVYDTDDRGQLFLQQIEWR